MSETNSSTLRRTLLHAWHVAHGARMVPFAGWDMPVQYAAGVTREHIATRTHAGIFDVCHMGRFRVTGPSAATFLSSLLTNDPNSIAPGQAHYTLLASEQGGAVDDAYLYQLAAGDFLLVVNASNRDKDWAWLRARGVPAGVTLDDDSEQLAMLALQGPRSAQILESVIGPGSLPEARRNRVGVARFGASELIIARTGYTGESVCFELFVPQFVAIELWARIVDAGAQPAGLGARDSLRLEAGLPLYGHEFGRDADGAEIPIFANGLARFGVRPAGRGAYVGSKALEQQRAEFDAIAQGTCTVPPERRLLKRLVKPIAVFDSRRPLRAGYRLFLGDEPAGYVTSGTSVPVARTGAGLADQPEMRPIGLALVRSDLRYSPSERVRFAVRDARGEIMTADLVERNLPAPTY
jgi:aminomethyltransferase